MPIDMREVRRNLQLLVRHGAMTRAEADRRLAVWEANKDRPEPEWIKDRAYEITVFGATMNVQTALDDAASLEERLDALGPTLDERSHLVTFRAHYVGRVPWPDAPDGLDLFHAEPDGRPIYLHPLDLAEWKPVDDA